VESKTFKSVTFGGFDKQDVISYIQQTAKDTAAAQTALEAENERLKAANRKLTEEAEHLRALAEQLSGEQNRLKDELAHRVSQQEDLLALRKERDQLGARLEEALPQAEAYRKVKDQIGDIECQAQKRANDLEASTKARLEQVVTEIRSQYLKLANVFNTTSDHVTGELRKVEVNLSQMPRALDQAGVELNTLEKALHGDQD